MALPSSPRNEPHNDRAEPQRRLNRRRAVSEAERRCRFQRGGYAAALMDFSMPRQVLYCAAGVTIV